MIGRTVPMIHVVATQTFSALLAIGLTKKSCTYCTFYTWTEMKNDTQLSDEQLFMCIRVLFLQTEERLIFDISATSSSSQRPEMCIKSR